MSYTPNGLFNHTAAIYQMLTGYPPDKVSPSGQLEPPNAADFPTAGSHVSQAEAAEGAGAAVRRIAAAAAGIGHHRQGRRGRIPRQGVRSVPAVSGSGAEPIKLEDLSLRKEIPPERLKDRFELLKGINGSMPDLEKALNAVRHRRVLRQGVRPRALRQGARRVRPRRRNRTRCASATACTPSARAC